MLEARQTLLMLAQIPQLRQQDPDAAKEVFASLLSETHKYAGFGVSKPNGDVIASAPPIDHAVNFSDRAWFQRVVQSRSFVIGEYLVGRVSGKPTVVLGYPVLDPMGQLTAVLSVGLDLERLQKMLLGIDLPDGATLTVIDSAGTILLHHPDPEKFAGKKMPEHPLIKAMLTQKQGAQKMDGLEGTSRLYGYITVGSGVETLHVCVGIPEQLAYADVKRQMARNLTGFGAVSALALVGAWLFGGLLIVSPVRKLIDATHRVAAGDLTARTGLIHARGEIGVLALQFDQMAESLQHREVERSRAQETLQESEKQYRQLYALSEQQNQVLSALFAISQAVNQSLDLDQFLNDALEKIMALFKCHSTHIRILDEQTQELAVFAQKGLTPAAFKMLTQRLKIGGSIVDLSIKSGRVEIVEDITTDPRTAGRMEYAQITGIRSIAVLPLYAQNKLCGTMSIRYLEARIYNDEEIKIFTSIGHLLGAAIENARLYQEQGKTIKQLKDTQQSLQQSQKMEAIGTLAGGVAHDFNNLMTIIIGNADLILMDLDKRDPAREGIEAIKKAGHSAASLTRQLLAFSRKDVIQPVALDLNQVLEDLAKMLKRLIKENIEFKIIPAPALLRIKMDPGQMEQVVINLTVNAGDAMPGGGMLTIATANMDLDEDFFQARGIEAQPGPYVMLAVSDTGSGMDPKTQERIFEPFFTTKEIGKGTGLGLSTVYGIVKQNNGVIWVHSAPGQGATFKIYLPAVKEAAAPEVKEQVDVRQLGGSETLLIVEDDHALRNLARQVLEKHGYRILTAENGEDALRISKAHAGPIHLMLTDVVMPKMSGKETAARLQPLYPRMKVLYMSGYPQEIIAPKGVLASGVNFIKKPFRPQELAQKVRKVLDRKPD
ncbi:MAG: response regulator [Desulfobacterales bacterium]|nr:response regulator [Desulfobacterales bacterium]